MVRISLNKQQKKDKVKAYYEKKRQKEIKINLNQLEKGDFRYKDKHFNQIQRKVSCIRHNYALSKKKYLDLFVIQDYKCILCGSEIKPFTRKSHIDHCHKTNKVRGILCNKCNLGLGMFKENVDILNKAISYLNFNNDK